MKETSRPLVTIIIPHWKGKEVLRRCLSSLKKTRFRDYGIIVVDNGSRDGSMSMVQELFPRVQVVASKHNLGFAGGCNLGIRHVRGPFIVLLNDDAEVTPDWLEPLVRAVLDDRSVAAVQPKILSLADRKRFDYCGGAGGEIDIFGYPFARGRLFQYMENDTGQYDAGRFVFWASGAACLIRKEALDRVGLLDEYFFAHMEEIDLNWRFHLAGYHVRVVTDSVVYHQTGGTLGQDSLRKMVLNHRNNLLMVLKNYELSTLLWLLPIRLMLELMTIGSSILFGQPKRALAVVAGFLGVIRGWKSVWYGRQGAAGLRILDDARIMKRMYRGSAALAFFMAGIHRVTELRGWKVV